ncbi:ubiquitin fusion degradation protein 1 [Nematocida minor]|uniref:ubiquitin fusion degradation protein 1 n=1 Tax=Nematocida minor TaxID=1912983 RepID=UPI00221EF2DD|nr:ubiquitin fusion degradation protein 1 [Nematocida minor]KAI5191607.1 ubiquitin fusion degradation protein 1 [Nematocida minor]
MFSRLFSRRSELEWTLTPKRYSDERTEHYSGKIFLPQICLVTLISKQVDTPYIFKISAHNNISYTHAGVQEFMDAPDEVILPNWLYDQLALDGTPVEVSCVSLPKGQFIRLLPQSKDFLDIENPKASLEESLRNYQVLSEGDTISLYIQSEFKHILFTVAEILPKGPGISIIDTDLEVDFLPPVDYIEDKLEDGSSLVRKTEDGGVTIADPFFADKEDGLGVVFIQK